jgi:hypothetical protein
MSVFDQIHAQGRAVQMQMRGASATHVSTGGVETAIVVVPGQIENSRDERGVVMQEVQEMWAEIPKSSAENGIASIGLADCIVYAGQTWGVSEIGRGALGMHYVKLQREVRREQAGRRTGIR